VFLDRVRFLTATLAALLLGAAPAHAAFRSFPEPMQLPGDASASAIQADSGTWMVGARPSAATRATARKFNAGEIGPGDFVVQRARARAFAATLRRQGLLTYAQPNALRATKQAVPDDPLSAPPDAWRAAVADPNIPPPPVSPTSPMIALLDTQLDAAHPEFAGSQTATLGGLPVDNLHGTATAAVAAAPVNGVGIVGVWPGARALNIPLPAERLTCSASAQGIQRAIQARAAVINMSYGSAKLCRAEYNALQLAVRHGIVPVAAAGNEFDAGNPLEFPASLPHVLTIGAVDATLHSSPFSNRNGALDLSAPGESIMTAVPSALDEDGNQDGYERLDGTSFSAPMVSAAVAWIRAARPMLTPDQAAQVVRLGARDIGSKGYDNDTGFGLLDVGSALQKAPPPVDPLEPNDDMTFVNGRSFGKPAPPVFKGRKRVRITALVDAFEDPADVYRVKVRRRSRVRVTAKPSFGNPILAGFRPGAKSLNGRRTSTSRHSGSHTERITLRNRSRRTRTFYVAVGVQRGGRSLDAGYALTIRRGG
jgi:hypothetical protein